MYPTHDNNWKHTKKKKYNNFIRTDVTLFFFSFYSNKLVSALFEIAMALLLHLPRDTRTHLV